MLADLAVLLAAVAGAVAPGGGVLWRGRWRAGLLLDVVGGRGGGAGGAHGQGVHARVDAAQLDVAQLLLEELDVAPAVAQLGVEAGADGLVVCLGPHGIGGIDQGLFPVNLLLDVLDGLIFVHGGQSVVVTRGGTLQTCYLGEDQIRWSGLGGLGASGNMLLLLS